jgi:cytochrome P450
MKFKLNQDQIFNIFHNFQTWALQNPDKTFSKMLLPVISLVEGLMANSPTYLYAKRLNLGSNFCCAGQVVMGEFATLESALTSPQARTWRLGTTVLDQDLAPNLDVGGRNVFPLAISDLEAGGNGDHEIFRQCMQQYILNDVAIQRQSDATAKSLLDRLATDYLEMPHDSGGSFFTDDQRGLNRFMILYLHYVLFGLDPEDQQIMNLLTQLYYTNLSTLHYFAGVGKLLQKLNFKGHKDLSVMIEQAATIYENSPALANFQENIASSRLMTRRELAKMMTSIMSIAALQGPLHLACTSMGFRSLPAYPGQKTAEINLTDYWDQLDLNDRPAVKLYLLECARFWAPVNASHRVATAPLTITIADQERTFPTGTKVLIPMSLGLLDESFWGETTYEFDPQRENLCPFHMGFHSVGDRHAGRICPGRDLALEMLIDILVTVGKVRRSS